MEYGPRTEYRPWRLQPLERSNPLANSYTLDADENGLLQGQKLERSPLETMNFQDENDFPKCQGVNRLFLEENVYPQYGDLKSNMFKTGPPIRNNHLQLERRDLPAKLGEKKCKGLQDPQAEVEQSSKEEEEKPQHPIDEDFAASMREHLQKIEDQKRQEREARRAQRKENRQSAEEGTAQP